MLVFDSPSPGRQFRMFWAAFFILIVVNGVAVFNTDRLVGASSSSARSQQAQLELDRYMSALKDVESGARGYAFTRDPLFLESYELGLVTLRDISARLNEHALPERTDIVQRLAKRRVALARAVVDLTASDGDRRELLALTREGKAAMDEVRIAVAASMAVQQNKYDERRKMVAWQTLAANLALVIGTALSLLVLAALFRLLNRQIAARRRAEEQLQSLNVDLEQRVRARTAELEQARGLLHTIIENIPATVFIKDVADDYRYVLINKAGIKLTGGSQEEFIGHGDHEIFPGELATQFKEEDQEIARTGKSLFVPEQILPTRDGVRIIEITKMLLTQDDGGNGYVLGILRDLTDQKELETQVREMQRLESVGRLTGGIAHDFNNLLAIIMGSIEMVREHLPEGSETAAIAGEALDAVMSGAELVRRLLAFARKQHLEPTAVDLNDRLPNITPLLTRAIGENIKVRVKAGRDLWRARIDATQVDDALVNLAINARDAMPDGGTLTIETANVVLDADYVAHDREVEPGDYVMLAVSDRGVGMSQDTIERAFEPFFTTKGEGKGTGLGLSQVFGWVKQSGGHIKIYSELGHGTTVKLYLPRALSDGSPATEPQLPEIEPRGHETILVVEDNPKVRQTVVRQLFELGFEVLEAEDGEDALNIVRAGYHFDLLLTDVVMPGGMNGYELAEEVKKLVPGLKLLFTSGYTELAEDGGNLRREARLLSKPYRTRDLGRAIRSVLEDGGEGTRTA